MIEQLLVENLTWIKCVARTFCHNKCDAEDLAGETILKILLNKDRYDHDRSFRLWVLVIMRNTYIVTRRKAYKVTYYGEVPDMLHERSPDVSLEVRQYLHIIRKCARESRCVDSLIKYAKGYSYKEIAELEHCTIDAVKFRIHHARALLLKQFEIKVYKS